MFISNIFTDNLYLPFHAAEQRNKERISDSAEYSTRIRLSDVARLLSSAGKPREAGSSERLPFLVRFWAIKNERI